MFTRTPYDKGGTELSKGYALLGMPQLNRICGEGTHSHGLCLPMYGDSWDKTAYVSHPRANLGHPLDITPTREANTHEEGYNTYPWILESLRYDSDRDGQIISSDCISEDIDLGIGQNQLPGTHPMYRLSMHDRIFLHICHGEMPEWSNGPDLKSGSPLYAGSGVRIPLSPHAAHYA